MSYFFLFLAQVSGALLTIQVGLNARLRTVLGSPVLTSFISIGIALVVSRIGESQTVPGLEKHKADAVIEIDLSPLYTACAPTGFLDASTLNQQQKLPANRRPNW